jgi:hypothetical protein
MRKSLVVASLILAVVGSGCSQPERTPTPKVATTQTSHLEAEPAPQVERVSLKTGTVYQCSVAVALASQVKGSASETLPANGYFRVAGAQPDGWYQVTVSDGSRDYPMWLDGATVKIQNLRECPEPQVAPALPSAQLQQHPVEASQANGRTDQVFITDTGKKSHCAGCRFLADSKISCSRADAQARGYTACSVCTP